MSIKQKTELLRIQSELLAQRNKAQHHLSNAIEDAVCKQGYFDGLAGRNMPENDPMVVKAKAHLSFLDKKIPMVECDILRLEDQIPRTTARQYGQKIDLLTLTVKDLEAENNQLMLTIEEKVAQRTFHLKRELAQAKENINTLYGQVDWVQDVYSAWGVKGVVVAGYFLASLMATKIRDEHKTLVCLEIAGGAGSGKSTLLDFMCRLFGKDSDSVEINPAYCTRAALSIMVTNSSNFPLILIGEDEQSGKAKFDWESTKALYHGRSPYVGASPGQGIDSIRPETFNGSIIVTQNEPMVASDAVLSRFCHVALNRDEHSINSTVAVQKLESMPQEAMKAFVSNFHEKSETIHSKFFDMSKQFEEDLELGSDLDATVIVNHAQLAAAVSCLSLVTDVKNNVIWEAQTYILNKMTDNSVSKRVAS